MLPEASRQMGQLHSAPVAMLAVVASWGQLGTAEEQELRTRTAATRCGEGEAMVTGCPRERRKEWPTRWRRTPSRLPESCHPRRGNPGGTSHLQLAAPSRQGGETGAMAPGVALGASCGNHPAPGEASPSLLFTPF